VWNAFVEAVRDGADDLPLELIGRVADGLAAETRAAELARTPMPDPPDAAWLALRARALLPTTATAEALREVRTLYEQALQRERDYVPALNGLALSLAYETDRTTDPQAIAALLKQADEASLRAIGAAPGDAETWRTRALVAQVQGQLTSATEAIERALMLNPYSSDSHSQHGVVLTATGRAQEAVAAFDRAIRINPGADNIGVYLYFRARALLYLGRYDEAIESCNRALAYTPDWPDFMVLAAAYAMKGDREQAARARSELLRREPDFRISWMLDDGVMQPHARQQRNEHLIAGLRRAGLPE
jgi:tetratricopeptide (TPR) repeat protein